jgi:hypothetical protein
MKIPYKRAFSRFHIQPEVVVGIGTYNIMCKKSDKRI